MNLAKRHGKSGRYINNYCEKSMLQHYLEKTNSTPKSVLFLGAHCDDIEIGCGGTILRLQKEYPNMKFSWVIFSSTKERKAEATASANAYLENIHDTNIIVKSFRNGYFPYIGAEIKDYFEILKREISPDIIFTHYRDDLHQDHRTISNLTWNTFRNHLILEYEIMKYDGDLGTPNYFVQLDSDIVELKIAYLKKYYQSQLDKQWFTDDCFRSLMRLRGIEANSHSGFAEAFYCRKLLL